MVAEAPVAYIPEYWFNFIDKFRIIVVDWSAMQTDCEVYYILGAIKTMLDLEGFMAVFARLVPQFLTLQT